MQPHARTQGSKSLPVYPLSLNITPLQPSWGVTSTPYLKLKHLPLQPRDFLKAGPRFTLLSQMTENSNVLSKELDTEYFWNLSSCNITRSMTVTRYKIAIRLNAEDEICFSSRVNYKITFFFSTLTTYWSRKINITQRLWSYAPSSGSREKTKHGRPTQELKYQRSNI